MSPDRALIDAVRAGLAAAADPAAAEPMRAYMKSALPFRGVRRTEVRRLCRTVFAAHPLGRSAWEATVRAMYDDAAYREERYAAIELSGHRMARGWQDPASLSLYDHLITTGAWWDLVDELAGNRVGPILREFGEPVAVTLRDWAADDDLWRRRTAILAQLKSKDLTDTDLLADCLEPSLGRGEFFLRKAIGWALREYSRTDPDWVRAYLSTHVDGLSPLSVREAGRHLPASAEPESKP